MKLLLSMVIVILSLPIQSARAESYTCVSLEYPPLIQQGRNGDLTASPSLWSSKYSSSSDTRSQSKSIRGLVRLR